MFSRLACPMCVWCPAMKVVSTVHWSRRPWAMGCCSHSQYSRPVKTNTHLPESNITRSAECSGKCVWSHASLVIRHETRGREEGGLSVLYQTGRLTVLVAAVSMVWPRHHSARLLSLSLKMKVVAKPVLGIAPHRALCMGRVLINHF